jgi:hypothetical protein
LVAVDLADVDQLRDRGGVAAVEIADRADVDAAVGGVGGVLVHAAGPVGEPPGVSGVVPWLAGRPVALAGVAVVADGLGALVSHRI